MHILPGMTQFAWHFLHIYGMWALFILLLVEEAGVPLPAPGDTFIALVGAQPHRTLVTTVETLALCTLAVFLGSSILYWVMRLGGRSFLNRYGRYMRLNQQRLDRIESWIVRRGPLAIILGRLIPGLRIPTTVMCGLSNVRYRVFAPSTALAGLIWSALYYLVGALLQRRVGLLTSYITGLADTVGDSTILTILAVALLLALLLGGWGLFHRWRMRQMRRAQTARQASGQASGQMSRQASGQTSAQAEVGAER
ncbi:MAG TPA: DedA family protein [Ktedonobacterales bacterium]|nr:DedA family protein [Ktedonobacterales bacterium]